MDKKKINKLFKCNYTIVQSDQIYDQLSRGKGFFARTRAKVIAWIREIRARRDERARDRDRNDSAYACARNNARVYINTLRARFVHVSGSHFH